MEEEPLVGAKEVCEATGIPRTTLYRLAEQRRIPAVVVEAPAWRTKQRREYRFRLSEVEAALRQLRESRPPYAPSGS